MHQIVLDAEAGHISAELSRRCISTDAKVHVVIELLKNGSPPMAAIAQAGQALDWLADEPELYGDADLIEYAR